VGSRYRLGIRRTGISGIVGMLPLAQPGLKGYELRARVARHGGGEERTEAWRCHTAEKSMILGS
jgi:hypothetical protein